MEPRHVGTSCATSFCTSAATSNDWCMMSCANSMTVAHEGDLLQKHNINGPADCFDVDGVTHNFLKGLVFLSMCVHKCGNVRAMTGTGVKRSNAQITKRVQSLQRRLRLNGIAVVVLCSAANTRQTQNRHPLHVPKSYNHKTYLPCYFARRLLTNAYSKI